VSSPHAVARKGEADRLTKSWPRGKHCLRGLRITVYDVLDYLASGMTEAQILHDFPDLAAEAIRAASPSRPTAGVA
jgi:uncharacterized protein (DUF433 family)